MKKKKGKKVEPQEINQPKKNGKLASKLIGILQNKRALPLVVFIVGFATLGAYLLISSFAATNDGEVSQQNITQQGDNIPHYIDFDEEYQEIALDDIERQSGKKLRSKNSDRYNERHKKGNEGVLALTTDITTISGRAFKDANKNSQYDSGEEIFTGKYMQLSIVNADGTLTYVGPAQLNSEGKYAFTVNAGTKYMVQYDRSAFYDIWETLTPSTTGSIYPRKEVTPTGPTTVDFGFKEYLQSETALTTFTSPNGTKFHSHIDVFTAEQYYNILASGKLFGLEAPKTELSLRGNTNAFDSASSSISYRGNIAEMSSFTSGISNNWYRIVFEDTQVVFHEYGHAWSLYYNFNLDSAGKTGLGGKWRDYTRYRAMDWHDPRLNNGEHKWALPEIIAEDYVEFFSSDDIQVSDSHENQILASPEEIPGLKEWLSGPFMDKPDTNAGPAFPYNLAVNTITTNSVNLSWGQSVNQAGYKVYRDGREIATTTSNSYSVTGLPAGTPSSFAVRAFNSSGTLSHPSNAAYAITLPIPDTTPPSAITDVNILRVGPGSSSVYVDWSPPADNVGVTGYQLFVNGTHYRNYPFDSYGFEGLKPGTPYNFTVKAVDAAGNVSAISNTATATTLPATDNQAPTAPTLTSPYNSGTLEWSASTDNVGIDSYEIYVNDLMFTRLLGTTTSWAHPVNPGETYKYMVKAVDAAGNSTPSNILNITVPKSDSTAPEVPQLVTARGVSDTQVNLAWNPSLDSGGGSIYDRPDKYQVFRGNNLVGTSHTSSFADLNLQPGTTYQYTIKAVDKQGNTSAASQVLSIIAQNGSSSQTTTPPPPPSGDTTPPTKPTGLTATNITNNSIDLQWTGSTDNIGVKEYRIYQPATRKNPAVMKGIATSTSFTVTGLKSNASFSFYVIAVDYAGNQSLPSNTVSAKTRR